MCGIAGCVAARGGAESPASRTRVMMDSLARRGPDSKGFAEWPGVALGHRRLAIIDLSPAGHQPMLSDDGQTAIVFNGCIYNFREIRSELEKLGHRFHSQCDTEVLLLGYLAWGIDDLVKRLRGMFAFAVWDNLRGVLTLVRDRMGVKPLVYCHENGYFAFASTAAALRAAGFGSDIDPESILEFLEYGYVTDTRAVREGICKLPPAGILEFSGGEIRRRTYWSLPETDESSPCSFDDAVDETERLLVDAVRVRLVSDVPIAVLLSGGIDSALICWALKKLNAGIKAFTVKASNDPTDESAAAAHTAGLLGISHEIISMPETSYSLDELTDAFSEPFSCQSAQAMLWVSKAIKPNATVLLTGDGGDDVFLGYPFFKNAWSAEKIAHRLSPGAARFWQAAAPRLPFNGPIRRAANFLNYATGGIGPHLRANNGLPYYEKHALLGPRLIGRTLKARQVPASLEAGRHLLNDVIERQLKVHFPGEFMVKVDGATMYYALESRAPFLDQRIWEFALTLPPSIRLRGGMLKAVLREIARRRLGPKIAFRRKQGFTVPVERWYAGRWSGMIKQLRSDTLLERQQWIRPGSLAPAVDTALREGSVPIQLVHLLVLENWLRKNG